MTAGTQCRGSRGPVPLDSPRAQTREPGTGLLTYAGRPGGQRQEGTYGTHDAAENQAAAAASRAFAACG